ncbi:hypothetical protein [Maledivibacter halophilus]|uniref:Uncharacterized protein n=1 Tax=Maledivibacter halophilus TaxID=36842 RepID=A0A1T5LPH8_9FIRM|nr:hypothetical protein [Maledivibacter halophilus]SKC77765.1 hypothetical protein SAMN02194393_03181 [Maledivibacter halophilus]
MGRTFSNQYKCDHCLYLLHKEKRKDIDGQEHIRYYCMIKNCVKEGEEDGK